MPERFDTIVVRYNKDDAGIIMGGLRAVLVENRGSNEPLEDFLFHCYFRLREHEERTR